MKETKLTGSALESLNLVLSYLDRGFFVIDPSGTILPEISHEAKNLFGQDLAGKNFAKVLPGDESVRRNAQSWIELVFSGQMEFDDFLPVAPLFFLKNDRRIELRYRPIYEGGKNSKLLKFVVCIAADKTEEYNLRIKAEYEFTLVQVIMAAVSDKPGFVSFVLEAKRNCHELFAELAKPNCRIDHVFRLMHSLKGGFSAYYFTELSRTTHQLETELAKLKEAPAAVILSSLASIRDTLKMVLQKFEGFLKEHEATLGQAQEVTDRTKQLRVQSIYDMSRLLVSEVGRNSVLFKHFLANFVQEEVSTLFQRYENVARGIAERQEKQVELTVIPSQVKVFSEPYLPMISAYVHVFRNAVDHGIEDPQTRISTGKKSSGTIKVSFECEQNSNGKEIVRIKVADDGRGIDPNIVRKKAIEKGLGEEADIKALSDENIIQLLFHTGFSTRDEVTDLSGRGVGLDAVQFEVERLGGRVWVETKHGRGTSVIAEVPLFKSIDDVFVEEDFAKSNRAA